MLIKGDGGKELRGVDRERWEVAERPNSPLIDHPFVSFPQGPFSVCLRSLVILQFNYGPMFRTLRQGFLEEMRIDLSSFKIEGSRAKFIVNINNGI